MALPAPEKVVITADDIRLIEEFFTHFNDPAQQNLVMQPSLQNEIQLFKSDPDKYTVADQTRLRAALCESFSKTTHQLLRDEALKPVMQATEEIYNEAKFYEELETALTEQDQPAE